MICYVLYIMFIMNIIALFESSGFWVLGSGFWVLGSGLWVLGCGGSFVAKYIFAAKPPPPFLIFHFSFKRGFQMKSKGDPPP